MTTAIRFMTASVRGLYGAKLVCLLRIEPTSGVSAAGLAGWNAEFMIFSRVPTTDGVDSALRHFASRSQDTHSDDIVEPRDHEPPPPGRCPWRWWTSGVCG